MGRRDECGGMSQRPIVRKDMNVTAIDETRQQVRTKILSVEERLRNAVAAGAEEANCPLKHHFAPGAYGREIFIPAGSLVVGKIHKHAHLNMLMKGRVSVATEEGVKHLEAPLTMVSPPGTKRVVYAHEDTVWVTVHLTNETDLEKIEDHVIAKSYDEYTAFVESNKGLELMCTPAGLENADKRTER